MQIAFIDIQNFQTKYAEGFNLGDIIQITEKVDGSNACLCLSDDHDLVHEPDGEDSRSPCGEV